MLLLDIELFGHGVFFETYAWAKKRRLAALFKNKALLFYDAPFRDPKLKQIILWNNLLTQNKFNKILRMLFIWIISLQI